MRSTNQKVRLLEGLINTKHVSEWESNFIATISRKTRSGQDTSALTEKQLEIVERLHDQHFA